MDFAAIVVRSRQIRSLLPVQSPAATVAHLRADRRTSSPKVKQTLTDRRRMAAEDLNATSTAFFAVFGVHCVGG
jgi:hypothetical protein